MNNIIKIVPRAHPKQIRSADLFVEPHEITSTNFIKRSFYLPVDVLTDEQFKVEPIRITTGSEFHEFMRSEAANAWKLVPEGASHQMLWAAKQLGVSCRLIKATGERIMVVKLWYGDKA